MLGIVKFLAFLTVLSRVNCFWNPLTSLLLEPLGHLSDGLADETMMAAVKQLSVNDAMEPMMDLMSQQQMQMPQQQQQQPVQQQANVMRPHFLDHQQEQDQLQQQLQQPQQQQLQQQQQQLQQQQLQQQQQQLQQQQLQQQQLQQKLQLQQQQQQQLQQQQQQQQPEQQRVQKQQRLQQSRIQKQQQQRQKEQQQQQQYERMEKLSGMRQQHEEVYKPLENEEILQDFQDLQQKIDHIREKLVRTIDITKGQVESQQSQLQQQYQQMVQEQQRLEQQLQQSEQLRTQLQQQQQQIQQQQPLLQQQQQQQIPQQQQLMQQQLNQNPSETISMLRSRGPVSPMRLLADDWTLQRPLLQTDRLMEGIVPILTMKIDTIDQISPLSLLNQIMQSQIMQNPLMPLAGESSMPQSCNQVQAKHDDANRIRIQHSLVRKLTYRFESSTCQCQQQIGYDHCSLAYSRPDPINCKVTEFKLPHQASNCEALEACKAQGAQCDGVYHDGAKLFLVECAQQGQRVLSQPGLDAEYVIQMRNCF